MEPTNEQTAQAVGVEASRELQSAAKLILHCLNQLSEEQIWWRPHESMNSIGNLILHVNGNVRQWIVSGVAGAEDNRDRPSEFSEQGPIPTAELCRQLDDLVAEAVAVMTAVTPTQLLEPRRIQAFDTTGLGAIFHSAAHFRGHTQEIVHLARCQLGNDYKFEWAPITPEQGASN